MYKMKILSFGVLAMSLCGCPKKSTVSSESTTESTETTEELENAPVESDSNQSPETTQTDTSVKITLTKYNTMATCAIEDDSSEEAEQLSIKKANEIFTVNQSQIQTCFDTITTTFTEPETIQYTIVDGAVTSVTFSETFETTEVASCIREKILTWTFFNNCSDTGTFNIERE